MRKFPFWLLIVLIAWIIFGSWYWHCIVKDRCGYGFTEVVVDDKPKVPFNINGAGFNLRSEDHFSFTKNGNSPRIPFETSQALDKLEDYLAVNPNVNVNVEGLYRNTDLKPEGYNNLGLARAESLKERLVSRGFRRSQITTSTKVVNSFTEYRDRIIGGANLSLKRTAPPVVAKAPPPPPPPPKPKPKPKPVKVEKPKIKRPGLKKKAIEKPKIVKPVVKKDGLIKKAVDFSKTKASDYVKGQRIELKNVQFASGSSKLKSTATTDLNKLFSILNKNKKINIEVGGHTDNTGSLSGNNNLSRKRAESVKAFLLNKGIGANRISTQGYGPSLPIANNKTPIGRASNRRVEIKIK